MVKCAIVYPLPVHRNGLCAAPAAFFLSSLAGLGIRLCAPPSPLFIFRASSSLLRVISHYLSARPALRVI